jgi:hypothetical protein
VQQPRGQGVWKEIKGWETCEWVVRVVIGGGGAHAANAWAAEWCNEGWGRVRVESQAWVVGQSLCPGERNNYD